jgi:hypothetical protein
VALGYTPEDHAAKDASGGFAGLTGFLINLKNAAGSIVSFMASAATVARTWTFPDKSGTVAMTSDVITDHTALSNIGIEHAHADRHGAVSTGEHVGHEHRGPNERNRQRGHGHRAADASPHQRQAVRRQRQHRDAQSHGGEDCELHRGGQ